MKGTLHKTEQGWMVRYDQRTWQDPSAEDGELHLHPDHIEMMDTCFTSKFIREVEFEIVNIWEKNVGDLRPYAKLIHHSVDTNEMIDHIGDANKMVDHVPDVGKMVEQIEKLAELNGSPDSSGFYDYKEGFVDGYLEGYNNPKETLYTKQDVIDSVVRMYDIFMDDTLEAKMLRLKGISWHIQNTLESLKQPKK